jgi:hypothetical protein
MDLQYLQTSKTDVLKKVKFDKVAIFDALK